MYFSYTAKTMALLCSLVIIAFSSCIKDECSKSNSYTFYRPLYKTKTELRENIKSNAPQQVENPGKLSILGKYIFLNETDKGVHVIDNANPAAPRRIAFIDIPGNMDMAIKGNTLYADMYTDLVTIDISNPANAQVKKIQEGVFPHRAYGFGFVGVNSNDVFIAEWVRVDTTIISACNNPGIWLGSAGAVFANFSSSADGNRVSSSPIGVGGSMARFTIMTDWLYTVGDRDLQVFNIQNAYNPAFQKKIDLEWGIETIYPFKDKLFIGSQTGMFIYNVTNPANPVAAGQFTHVRSCDPVVADDNHAYITLRSGNTCMGFTNELNIVKLNNFTNPTLVKKYELTNPHGLSKDNNLLFICDGDAGLRVFNAADVNDLKPLQIVDGISTYDVIAMNNVALVVAKDGLYQYDYSTPSNLKLLSKLGIAKK